MHVSDVASAPQIMPGRWMNLMKTIVTSMMVLGLLLVSCTTQDTRTQVQSTTQAVARSNGLRGPMTVDQFVRALRSGKTPADLQDHLGIPLIATMRVHYFLADGVALQSVLSTNKAITIRRDDTKEEIIIQQPLAPIQQ